MQPPTPLPPPPIGTTKESPRRWWTTPFAIFVLIVSGLYLINPGFGVFEILPDNIPLLGNIDEAFFTLAFVSALASLGVRLPFLTKK
ncbi:MAG: DUF1232 domain-containing protein [Phycisphaerales bacterium]|nr:DUF1232 domain-containing protein [Phycisphaerales bacterium]